MLLNLLHHQITEQKDENMTVISTITTRSDLAEIQTLDGVPHSLPDSEMENVQVRDVYRCLNDFQFPLTDDQKTATLGIIFGSVPSAIDPVVLAASAWVVECCKQNTLAYAKIIGGVTGAEVRLVFVRLRVVGYALKALAAAMYFFSQLADDDKVEARRILEAGLKELS